MTVKDLVEKLKDCPQEATIVISVDEEGNWFEAVREVMGDNTNWNADAHTTGIDHLTPFLAGQG